MVDKDLEIRQTSGLFVRFYYAKHGDFNQL